MRRLTLSLLLVFAVAVSGIPASAITGGSPDGQQHPNVGALVLRFNDTNELILWCSGSLVAPKIVLTAAHCDLVKFPPQRLATLIGVTFDAEFAPTTSQVVPVVSEPEVAIISYPGYGTDPPHHRRTSPWSG